MYKILHLLLDLDCNIYVINIYVINGININGNFLRGKKDFYWYSYW